MKILNYPKDDFLLRLPCQEVTKELVSIVEFQNNLAEMKKTLKLDGMGLAASQVGWHIKLFMMAQNENLEDIEPKVFFNPVIISTSKKLESDYEGCLSFPGLSLKLARPYEIIWEYEDENFNKNKVTSKGYYARAIQHEVDHLNKKLFVDRIDSVQRLKFEKWLKR